MNRLPPPKQRVLQPTSFDKVSAEERILRDMKSAFIEVYGEDPFLNPLRHYGYTANPATCPHIHQRFKTKWICADCGKDL